MVSHIVTRMSNVIKLIVINATNDVLSRQRIIQSTMICLSSGRYIPNPSPFNDANSIGQNHQIGNHNLANQTSG